MFYKCFTMKIGKFAVYTNARSGYIADYQRCKCKTFVKLFVTKTHT